MILLLSDWTVQSEGFDLARSHLSAYRRDRLLQY